MGYRRRLEHGSRVTWAQAGLKLSG